MLVAGGSKTQIEPKAPRLIFSFCAPQTKHLRASQNPNYYLHRSPGSYRTDINASAIFTDLTVSPTSCERTIWAPSQPPIVTVASEPASLSAAGAPPRILPRKDFRDVPTSIGYWGNSRTSRSSFEMSCKFCSRVLLKPT